MQKRIVFPWKNGRRTILWPDHPLVMAGSEVLPFIVNQLSDSIDPDIAVRNAAQEFGLEESELKPYVESISAALEESGVLRESIIQQKPAEFQQVGLSMATLNLTRECNLSCQHCYANQPTVPPSPATEMSPEDLEVAIGVLGKLIAHPPRLLVVSGGEPTLRDTKLETVIAAARKSGLNPRLNTNGYSLNSSAAEFLAEHDVLTQVSLDGVDAQTHALLRRAEDAFERTLSAIKLLTRHGVRVRISFTVHSGNAHQIPAMLTLAEQIGVEHVVTSSLVEVGNALVNNLKPVEFAEEFAVLYNAVKDSPLRQRMTRSTLLAETIAAIRAGIRFTYCGTGLSTCCIDADGSVYPCINMVRTPFKGGNICDKDFPEKWSALWPGLRSLDVDSINPQCARCFCRYFCGAYCRGETLEAGKSIRAPYVRCSSWKKALIRVFQYLSETPDIFAIDDDPLEAMIHRE